MPGSESREQRHLVSTASLFVSECLDADFQQEASCCRTVQGPPSLSDLLTPTLGFSFSTLLCLDPFSSGSQGLLSVLTCTLLTHLFRLLNENWLGAA